MNENISRTCFSVKCLIRFRLLSIIIILLMITSPSVVLISQNASASSQSQITGIVTDAQTGDPIEGADVYIYDPGDKDTKTRQKEGFYQTQTDAEGYYELDCEPGDYHIYVSKDGYNPYDVAVTIDGQVVHNVELTPGTGSKDDDKKDDTSKDYPDKEYPDKDDTTKEDDPSKNGGSNQDNQNMLLVSATIAGVLIVIVVLLAILLPKKKGKTEKSKTRKAKIKGDQWTTCSECGTSLKQKNLQSHINDVHKKMRTKNGGRLNE